MPEATLDILDAESEGSIGYMIDLELTNELNGDARVAALLTQTVVNEEDPAFKNPTKFIGPQFDEEKVISRPNIATCAHLKTRQPAARILFCN